MVHCSHALADCVRPSSWLPQKWVRGQCTAAHVPRERLAVPASRRVSIEFQLQGHRSSPLVCRHPRGVRLFGAVGHPAAKEGPAACGERGHSRCPPRPCVTAALRPRAPTRLFPPGGSSPAPPASLLRHTPCTRPSFPRLHIPGRARPSSGSASPAMSPAACHTKPGSSAHPEGFACAAWPSKKAYTSHFPRGKNKEASGADVILQCRADCVSMSAGSWDLSRAKQGEAAGGCSSLRRGVHASGRAELPLGCVGVPAARVLLHKPRNAGART